MDTAIYIRVSKVDMNPENQRLELEDFATRNGWCFDVYEERESTRRTRPVKELLLNKLRAKQYDRLVIWKLDRWGRSLQELVANLKELSDKGIKIVSLKENIDYSNASGQLFANMLSCFAEYERAIIRERTIAGLERAKSQGKIIGRPPGKKDSRPRRKSGYHLRWAGKKSSHVIS